MLSNISSSTIAVFILSGQFIPEIYYFICKKIHWLIALVIETCLDSKFSSLKTNTKKMYYSVSKKKKKQTEYLTSFLKSFSTVNFKFEQKY